MSATRGDRPVENPAARDIVPKIGGGVPPLDSDKVKALRERLFGNWEMNWVGFNYARDFTLPGQQDGPIGFPMYPYAETMQGHKDWLDPDTFSYRITSQEVA